MKKKGTKTWGRGWGDEGVRLSQAWKQNVISASAKRKQCLLLGEAYLAACSTSRGWGKHCGMTLLQYIFCLCSCQIQRHSVCTGKRSRENRVDSIGKLVHVDTVVLFNFQAHINRWDRGFCTQSVWWQGASIMTTGQGWCVPEILFWLQYV